MGHKEFAELAARHLENNSQTGWKRRAVTGAYWLHAVSHQGIEISRTLFGDAAEILLVPWGSVLMLNGLVRGDLEQETENTFAFDRRELLDRPKDPQLEDRNVSIDARCEALS